MDLSKCPICKNSPKQPINLKCDHHPCFHCATSIMTVYQQNDSQTKYRIVCPQCKKKTITYDIRHLIVSMTEQNQDLYCTTKYITKKAQVVVKKSNNYCEGQRNSICSKRNSSHHLLKQNTQLETAIKIDCKKHPHKRLHYFCETCFKNEEEQIFFCQECSENHKHQLSNIRDSQYLLVLTNQQKISGLMPQYKTDLTMFLKELGQRKQSVKNDYEKIQKQITEQFKKVYQSINKQFQNVKKDMRQMYNKQYESIKNTITLATRLKDSLSGLEKMYRIDGTQIQGQISFHNYFIEIQRAIESNKRNLSRAMQVPSIIKKSLISFNSEPLIQLGLQPGQKYYHQRKNSKFSSAIVSPKAQDYSSQGQKNKKICQSHSKKASKQNISSCVSPRQKLNFQSLLFGV